jgi:D-inositol-3-phosphate glycosyltransferase
VGGLREVVLDDRTGLLVPPGDPSALADAIARFYASGRESLYRKGVREEKPKYSWQNLVSAIEELTLSFGP